MKLPRNPFTPGQLDARCKAYLARVDANAPLPAPDPQASWFYFQPRPGDRRQIHFNSANLQFHSVYDPEFRHGYEVEIGFLIDTFLPRDGLFVDAGANWGHFSLHAASTPGFRGEVHAYEPHPATFADLSSVIAQSGLNCIQPHQIALGEANREVVLTNTSAETSGTVAVGTDATSTTIEGISAIETTLDQQRFNRKLDLLKVDVEGYENQLFRGARQTLKTDRPLIVFENWYREQSAAETAPLLTLAELGYRLFVPSFGKNRHGTTLYHYNANRRFARLRFKLEFSELPADQRASIPDERLNILAVPEEQRSLVAPYMKK